MWTDAALENWRLRQRVELSTTRPNDDVEAASSSPSPYERVQSGNGVVRFKRKPVEVAQSPIGAVMITRDLCGL